MLQGEHSAIYLTVINLPFVIKIFILSIFDWPFYTGFIECISQSQLRLFLFADGVCPSVLESIWQIKPFNVVPFVLILQVILQ